MWNSGIEFGSIWGEFRSPSIASVHTDCSNRAQYKNKYYNTNVKKNVYNAESFATHKKVLLTRETYKINTCPFSPSVSLKAFFLFLLFLSKGLSRHVDNCLRVSHPHEEGREQSLPK